MSTEKREGSIAEKPLRRFQSLSASLEKLILSIAQDWENAAKVPLDSTGDGVSRPIHVKMRKAQLLFTELHSTARQTHSVIERLRSKVAVSKQSMDENHLQLENLLYERDYLSRETQLCKDFTMSELGKMEEDEEQGFLEDVDTLQTEEEHARNLRILTDQKDKRRRSQQELEHAQIRIKGVNAAISDSKQYLSKLPDHLKDVEKALVPLKKNMPWRPGARRGRHEQAADLPGPLFILYCQLEAYCDFVQDETACEEENTPLSLLSSTLSLTSHDQGIDAPAVSLTLASVKAHVSALAKAAAEGPNDSTASAIGDKRASHKGTSSDTLESCGPAAPKRARLLYREEFEGVGLAGADDKIIISKSEGGRLLLDALKPSPLEVVLTLNIANVDGNDSISGGRSKSRRTKNGGEAAGAVGKDATSFAVRFSYLPALGIVTVCPQAGFPPCLLVNLFPNDTGRDTPNPSNHHSRAARASASGVFEFPSDVPCRPYLWAQWLAGLHFPHAAEIVGVDSADAQFGAIGGEREKGPIEPSTRAVMSALRSRLRTHASLAEQLRNLPSKGLSPSTMLQDEVLETTGNIELRSWKEMSGPEIQQAAKTFAERDTSTAGDKEGAVPGGTAPAGRQAWERYGARYFKGSFKIKKGRGKDRVVEMQVEVPSEYPLRPSLISLAEDGNSSVQEELRMITNEVNSHYDTLLTEDVTSWDQLLSKQVSLVMECLVARPVGGFVRLRRGRMRRKPVMFDRLERTFVHR